MKISRQKPIHASKKQTLDYKATSKLNSSMSLPSSLSYSTTFDIIVTYKAVAPTSCKVLAAIIYFSRLATAFDI